MTNNNFISATYVKRLCTVITPLMIADGISCSIDTTNFDNYDSRCESINIVITTFSDDLLKSNKCIVLDQFKFNNFSSDYIKNNRKELRRLKSFVASFILNPTAIINDCVRVENDKYINAA